MVRVKIGNVCCVCGCPNSHADRKERDLHFYSFPNKPWLKERRDIWIKFVKRVEKDGQPWVPNKNSCICSDHFVNGWKSSDPRKPNYNPTLYGKSWKQTRSRLKLEKKDADDDGKETVVGEKEGCLVCSQIQNNIREDKKIPIFPGSDGNDLLNRQLWSMFVLRNLLQISPRKINVWMKKTCGIIQPWNWFLFCSQCSDLVKEALSIHNKIMKLTQDMDQIRYEIQSALTTDVKQERIYFEKKKGKKDTVLPMFHVGKEVRHLFLDYEPILPRDTKIKATPREATTTHTHVSGGDDETQKSRNPPINSEKAALIQTRTLGTSQRFPRKYAVRIKKIGKVMNRRVDESKSAELDSHLEVPSPDSEGHDTHDVPETDPDSINSEVAPAPPKSDSHVVTEGKSGVPRVTKSLGLSNSGKSTISTVDDDDEVQVIATKPGKTPTPSKGIQLVPLHKLMETDKIIPSMALKGKVFLKVATKDGRQVKLLPSSALAGGKVLLKVAKKIDGVSSLPSNVKVLLKLAKKTESGYKIVKSTELTEALKIQKNLNSKAVGKVKQVIPPSGVRSESNTHKITTTVKSVNIASTTNKVTSSIASTIISSPNATPTDTPLSSSQLQPSLPLLPCRYRSRCTKKPVPISELVPLPNRTIWVRPRKDPPHPTKCPECEFTIPAGGGKYHKLKHKLYNCMEIEADKKIKCKLCQTRFLNRKLIYQHIRSNHGEELGLKVYRCDSCDGVFLQNSYLNQHKRLVHTKQYPFFCEDCGAGFLYPKQFEDHRLKHDGEGRKIVCELCGLSFQAKTGLRKHVRNYHPEMDFSSDTLTSRDYFNKMTSKSQSAKDMPEPAPIQKRRLMSCKYCDIPVVNKRAMRQHLLETHKELYKHGCKECDACYTTLSGLQMHEKAIHLKEKPKCQYCSMEFYCDANLRLHFKKNACKKFPEAKKILDQHDRETNDLVNTSAT